MPYRGTWERGVAVAVVRRDGDGRAVGGAWVALDGTAEGQHGYAEGDGLSAMASALADYPVVVTWDAVPELRGLGSRRLVSLRKEVEKTREQHNRRAGARRRRARPASFEDLVKLNLEGPARRHGSSDDAEGARRRAAELRELYRTRLDGGLYLPSASRFAPAVRVGRFPFPWRDRLADLRRRRRDR